MSDVTSSEADRKGVHVCFVCTGNICRSPMAEVVFTEALRRAGYDCTHVAAQVSAQHLSADLIVALDSGHLAALRRLVAQPDRVVLLRSFDSAADGDLDVPDPYFGGKHGFDEVLGMVHAAVPGLLAWVRSRL